MIVRARFVLVVAVPVSPIPSPVIEKTSSSDERYRNTVTAVPTWPFSSGASNARSLAPVISTWAVPVVRGTPPTFWISLWMSFPPPTQAVPTISTNATAPNASPLPRMLIAA